MIYLDQITKVFLQELKKGHGIPVRRGKMNPLMGLSNKPPDMMIYNSMHDFLEKSTKNNRGCIMFCGTPCPIDQASEIHQIFRGPGITSIIAYRKFRDNFEAHFQMAKAQG